jgi:hypothetical protein
VEPRHRGSALARLANGPRSAVSTCPHLRALCCFIAPKARSLRSLTSVRPARRIFGSPPIRSRLSAGRTQFHEWNCVRARGSPDRIVSGPLTAAGGEVTTQPPGGRTRRDSAPPPEKRQARGEGRREGNGLLGPGGRQHVAHEPLISSEMVAEVPLAGLSFGYGTITDHPTSGRFRPDAGGIGSKAMSLR